jgi:phenylacetate-CoA ligase
VAVSVGERSVELFKRAAREIPAYRSFLANQHFSPSSVETLEDFRAVPVTTKDDYLKEYILQELVWPEDLGQPLLFCSTSGSTGEPYYFPRNEELSRQYSLLVEDFLRRGDLNKRTLVIVGFGMGVWIGGVITLRAFEIAAERLGAPVSILPTGYNKTEIFKALRNLAPNYDRVILIGYPPFIKELIDEAKAEDIQLKKLNLRFLFAAEAFTETFRDYITKKAGIANIYLDTLNIYGTADVGAMAYETPLSVLIRRLAVKDPLLFQDIFGQIEKTPTLAQYNPDFIEFEAVDGEILLTSNAALPLIRYAVGDNGGVIAFSEMQKILKRAGYDLASEMKKALISNTLQKHPFVYVYERKNLSATLHGINIYPEFIKEGLLSSQLVPHLTERFTMTTKTDRQHNQYLEINLELQKDVSLTKTIETLAAHHIRKVLAEKSSEFAEISRSNNNKKLLKFIFWPNNHPRYFTPGVKQKWVKTE